MSTDPAPIDGQAEAETTQEQTAAPAPSPFGDLGDDLRGYVENKKWTDPRQVVEAYKHLEGFRGVPEERLLKLPADPADMGEVWDRLGRPEAADKYTLAMPEELKDGVYDRMASAAHKVGLTDAQFQGLQSEFAEAVQAVQAEQTERVAADFEGWKAKNQADFNNVRNLLGASGITEQEMADAMSGNSAAFYGALAKVAARMGEKPAAGGEADGEARFGMTPAQARAKVEAMNADPAFQVRLRSDDQKVRLAAAEERRRYLAVAGEDNGSSEIDEANREIQRLRAQLRSQAGGI